MQVPERIRALGGGEVPDLWPAPLLEDDQCFRAVEGGVELLEILRAHPLEIVDAVGRIRSDPADGRRGPNAVRQERG